jgi:quercetin dioxygenase-like cupin family protein
MQINPREPTMRGPVAWFTGEVWMDTLVQPDDHSALNVAAIHFAPGARTAWHRHPFGQTIHVTEGAGLAQARGGPIEPLRAGDTVHFEAGEDHWHGADPENFMTHLAMQEIADDGSDATWGEHVTDAEYASQ